MSRCQPAHIPLAPKSPVEGGCAKKVVFHVSLGVIDGRVRLDMRQDGCKDQEFIAIEGDSEVLIELKGDQLYFSKDYDAITMKGDFAHFYGGLTYGDYDAAKGRYRSVRFEARFNKGGKRGASHPFNVNVDLHQPGGKPEWLPISIDPDIKNPPPWL